MIRDEHQDPPKEQSSDGGGDVICIVDCDLCVREGQKGQGEEKKGFKFSIGGGGWRGEGVRAKPLLKGVRLRRECG